MEQGCSGRIRLYASNFSGFPAEHSNHGYDGVLTNFIGPGLHSRGDVVRATSTSSQVLCILLVRRRFAIKQLTVRSPPKGPRDPPECWNLQPFAHCCALLASSSLQVKAEAPCCARTVLWAVRYCWISLLDVELSEELSDEPLPEEDPLFDA